VFDCWWRREEEGGRTGGIIYPWGEHGEAEL